MKLIRKVGTTSEILQLFIRDSSSLTGAGLAGLVFNSAGLTAYYHKENDTTATAITLVTMTVGTFTSGGFKEIDATNMPGWYQFCPPNAAFTGTRSVGFHLKGATNMMPLPIEVDLNAQVDLTHLLGSAVATPVDAGILDVNVKNFAGEPAIVMGDAGGPIINGANTGTVALEALTVSKGTILNNSNTNGHGLSIGANGTGNAIHAVAPGGGCGALISSTTGIALRAWSVDVAQPGCAVTSGASGHGFGLKLGSLQIVNAATLTDGLIVTRSTADSPAIDATGTGTGAGMKLTGGSGLSSAGLQLGSTATVGTGLRATGNLSGSGVAFTGGATGSGALFAGGPTSGSAFRLTTTSGHGLDIAPTGTNMHGIVVVGGNGGTSDGIKVTAGTGGKAIRSDIEGSLSQLTAMAPGTPGVFSVAALANAPSGGSGGFNATDRTNLGTILTAVSDATDLAIVVTDAMTALGWTSALAILVADTNTEASAAAISAGNVETKLNAMTSGAVFIAEALANAPVPAGLSAQAVRDAMKLAPTALPIPATGSIDLLIGSSYGLGAQDVRNAMAIAPTGDPPAVGSIDALIIDGALPLTAIGLGNFQTLFDNNDEVSTKLLDELLMLGPIGLGNFQVFFDNDGVVSTGKTISLVTTPKNITVDV